jgi:hypothetical protein
VALAPTARIREEQQTAARHALSVITWAERNGYDERWLAPRARDRQMIERARATIARMAASNPPTQVTVSGVTITFGGEPPRPRTSGEKWQAVSRVLAERPGVWACLGQQNLGATSRLRELGCEALSRSSADSDPKHPAVWARWPTVNGAEITTTENGAAP